MTSIVTQAFGGLIPRIAPQQLPPNAATKAENLKTFGNSLSSWRRGRLVTSPLMANIRSIYRMYDGPLDYWLTSDRPLDYVLLPGASDFRLFYTGEATPRKTTLALATSAPPYPANYREMGIPAPPAPAVAVGAAGTGTALTRNWICTYVTDLGEEGPPSPPSADLNFGSLGFTINFTGLEQGKKLATITRVGTVATVHIVGHGFYDGSKVTISGADQAAYNGTSVIDVIGPDDFTFTVAGAPATPATGTIFGAGNYGLSKMRIYRLLVSSAGIPAYQLVKERSLATAVDTDTVLDSQLGAICPSFEMVNGVVTAGSQWVQPPADLHSIILHPGNFAIGLSGKYVCCSEPNNLHAWPVRYRQALNYEGVGLGIVDSTVVAATKGKAEVMTGNHPLYLSKGSDKASEPCSSGRGIAALPIGVLYPTPNGMQLIGVGGSDNAMDDFAKRDQWKPKYFPDTIFAAIYQGAYFGFYDTGSRVNGFVFDRTNAQGPLTDLDYNITAIYVDPLTATMYYVDDDDIFEWEGDPLNLSPFDWTGKEHVLPSDVNLSVAQVNADWNAFGSDFSDAEEQKLEDQAYNAAILAIDPMANIPARANLTAYTAGQTVKLLDRHLYCSVGGNSGAGAPSLVGKVLGDNVADGTVTWKLIWQVQSAARGCLNENGLNQFTLDGSLLREPFFAVFDNRSLLFQLYARGDTGEMVLRFQKSLHSGDIFKLPGGYTAHVYQIRFSGNVETYSVKLSETIDELKRL